MVYALGILLLCIASSVASVKANENLLEQAETALTDNKLNQAKKFFTQLSKTPTFRTVGIAGLAKVAFSGGDTDTAEEYIEEVLAIAPEQADYLFWAGRIAGKQAQSASIFTKLGYARDAKHYFTQALIIDPEHQDSIIGLIRFHQQAPVMAGGDKESIPILFEKLRSVDQKTAYNEEAPILLDNNQFETAMTRYKAALTAPSIVNTQQFKFDHAMLLSRYGHYQPALDALMSIDISNHQDTASFATMRLYQLGKLAAESGTHIDLGIQSMNQYAAGAEQEKTISQEWVNFRLAQLKALKTGKPSDQTIFATLSSKTSDDYLKTKIQVFLAQLNGSNT
jgi:tetratricopeptide (TPR) repeat protein